jgi:hypothetical protein
MDSLLDAAFLSGLHFHVAHFLFKSGGADPHPAPHFPFAG